MGAFDKISWREFYLRDFFKFEKGNQNNMASLSLGDIPLVSARKVDNGFKDFVSPNNKKLFEGGIITLNVDGDGGSGIAYYQPHRMALDSHVAALIPKLDLNKYQLIFIAACITKQRNRFGHGYPINSNRLRSFKFMLPVKENSIIPDWEFIDDFQRTKEQETLKKTLTILHKRLTSNGISRYSVPLRSNWKEFYISDLFDAIRPNTRSENDYPIGNIPFVASGGVNNGITKFCQRNNDEQTDKGNCLTISPVDGSCYYQPFDFLGRGGAGSSILLLYGKNFTLNKYIGLFLSIAISKTTRVKYSYGRMASQKRILRDKIILPSTDNRPDFVFMSTFMQIVEQNILLTSLQIYGQNKDCCD